VAAELAQSEEFVERFRREATAAADFDHPNITGVYGFGEDGERLYMAMELLLGRDLKVVIESGDLGPLSERLRLVTEVAAGMAAGKTLDELKESVKLEPYASWANYERLRSYNVEAAYRNLTLYR